MKRDFDEIAKETFDLAVIGGGIIGAGIARDAALRGIKTLLIDKEDYAYGTTSTSSRLIHGGLRYLRRFEFKLVRQDMREREILLRIAPHLVHPLPFLLPINSLSERFVMAVGMRLYDILSFDKSVPSYHYLSREKTLEMEPGIKMKDLRGAYLFYDCQAPFVERLCMENVLSATEHGAVAVNHARCTAVLKDGNTVNGIRIEDTLTGNEYQVSARMIVNAAGPWMDIVHGMIQTDSKPMMRRTKGVHLLTSKISNNAMVLFAGSDGRLFFVIPWEGYTVIGTTDTDYDDDSDTVSTDADDVEYLLTEVRKTFPDVKKEDIFYSVAGLRALAGSAEGSASNVTRGHRLIDHEKVDGIYGIISIIGGKITGGRAIAEEVTDLIGEKLSVDTPCTTAKQLLPGAPELSAGEIDRIAADNGLASETVAHLNNLYGSRLNQVITLACEDERGKQPICPHSNDIIAQIWHAVQTEQALTISDFLLRRGSAGLASCVGMDAVETVADEMGKLLGWNDEEKQRRIDEYHSYVSLSQRYKTQTTGNQD